ncbi:MAG: threonine--tRNA ligase [Candidatus Kerfeldbacteria bacterium CG15_BIG_FIL_POST_REV_8_21_14_020_45_12]|uniref:Threonine--tRNA ligase n=1 Tax=Candidatus Kerfeldbacteria bacterium CG15_BIG_FIL_POST_REV_8_21_14_020_45_12 TaxID=2014247 RepID=A0A2M7H535_9BACT|nr:MAG: threonine--tRNA ligase [Candidatus Kerfeldbacteria bacterium CG15_BIG_FIL_POST_REV_8_21_14_020_45_12]PJA93602.1 MAG: threonine--tRNA ligase [Candidatus Kerfeldbacteria bacterium CG_4_9_14_3_um_filter_45_8]
MSNEDQLKALRHSYAHLLAAAVRTLWPEAQNAIGPAIESGFYQDFDMGDVKLSQDDLKRIEKTMRNIVRKWSDFRVWTVSPDEARTAMSWNKYKLEIIDDLASEGNEITLNDPGDFVDLCKGGHIENPAEKMLNFKLLSVAGAYWRGDSEKAMLTRIYGTAFFTEDELNAYLQMLEEAKKRDHRKLGEELDLFVFSDLVGPGLPLWAPKGALLRRLLNDYVQELREERGYTQVEIPHITKKDLYERSGHWEKFSDELFRIHTREGHEFALKPMNCPHHTQIFDRRPHSYREMPQRYSNTTMIYRDEQTGELHGLARVRSITQDDAHVFCRASQIEDEALRIWDIIDAFYAACGFEALRIRLSMHDPENMNAYKGDADMWERAIDGLRKVIAARGVTDFVEAPGEAAFYGPKIDFIGKDAVGREWQLATIQLDMSMPESFDLTCTNESGEKERIVMIHAAIMGAIERFLSILIEHHAGNFPLWLAPVQVMLAPVSDSHEAHCETLATDFAAMGLRVEVDRSGDTVGKKTRRAVKQRTPYLLVVGDKEMSSDKLHIRTRGSEEVMEVDKQEFIERISALDHSKSTEL